METGHMRKVLEETAQDVIGAQARGSKDALSLELLTAIYRHTRLLVEIEIAKQRASATPKFDT
jgi:hypothetical protein